MQQGDQVTGEVMQSIECPASMACLYYTHHLRRNWNTEPGYFHDFRDRACVSCRSFLAWLPVGIIGVTFM